MKKTCIAVGLISAFLMPVLAGCSDAAGGGNRTVSAAPDDLKKAREAQIERIKNDPNMPQAVKDNAIAQMEVDRSGQSAKGTAKK